MAGPFDEVLDQEERFRLSGYESGLSRGRLQGLADGFVTGYNQGVQLADEVGFYLGFAEYMLELLNAPSSQWHAPEPHTSCQDQPLADTETKARRALLLVMQYISEFPCLQLTSPTYLDHLNKIRTKFKQAASLLKIDVAHTSSKTIDF